ncbi:DUF2155 domain-containing protein [Robiginitomaculum antarcticum]|uniref:DUF2155 domain-containing protein n=1 Tax=Robiginitomaculum antarcticum TaxID=437507 RepID=UPI000377AD53|nr:DUF2155 domain-containing protein [Robiginitomaculum antarcticum]
MLRAICCLAALGLTFTAQAENLMGVSAKLRTLDKVTANTQDFDVKIGENLNFGSLVVSVPHCEKRPPEETPETYVFLQIKDKRLDGKGKAGEPETVFSGWMFGSSPALNALEHPVYDVWVIDCDAPPNEDELR